MNHIFADLLLQIGNFPGITVNTSPETPEIALREVRDTDLKYFFAHQQEELALRMAAFTHKNPGDRATFDAHWAKIRSSSDVIVRTILADGQVAGHVASFVMMGQREVTYWVGMDFWGKGVATKALLLLLEIDKTRPIHGRVAADNARSVRVLTKCGFRVTGRETGFANARGKEIEELFCRLD
jgi:RimJ/RimL family protein N-acetyltransferase